jgi:Secretion system C-terminal sorting domain
MKKSYLILSFFTVIQCAIFAQLKLVSSIEYTRNNGNIIINRDSTVYTHNSDNFYMASNEFKFDLFQGLPLPQEPYIYSNQVDFRFANSKHYYKVQTNAYTFNSENNRTTNSAGTFSTDLNTNGTDKKEYVYNANGQILVETEFAYNVGYWDTVSKFISTYNANGKQLTKTRWYYLNAVGRVEQVDSMKYNGSLEEKFVQYFYDINTNTLLLSAQTDFIFTSGILDYVDVKNDNGAGVLENNLRLKYVFTGANLSKARVFLYTGNVISTTAGDSAVFTYNANDDIIRTSYSDAGLLDLTYYDYFAPNFIRSASKDGTANTIFQKYEYQNFASIQAQEVNVPTVFPNPAKNKISFDVQDVEQISIVNAMGQLVVLQNGATNSVDVSALSLGIYSVYIQTKTGSLTAKFIKE